MKKLSLFAAIFATALTLTACGGGGGDEPAQVAASNTTLAITPATGATATAPFIGQSFAFSAGVPDFGTTAATTVQLTQQPPTTLQPSTATTPGFTITAPDGTAAGALEFGSCIFRITQSTFPAGHRLAAGNVITVANCNIRVNTAGIPADSSQATSSAALILGAAVSANTAVTLSVTPGGQLTVNGRSTGTVTLTPVTGG